MNYRSMAYRNLPPLERIMLRTEWQGPCAVFTGTPNSKGYPTIYADGRNHVVHRLAWQTLVGPIPEGLTLDHLCRNKACWWSDHLEIVSAKVNTLRGGSASSNNARKTHCSYGHEFNEENTRFTKQGHRRCNACRRERKQ